MSNKLAKEGRSSELIVSEGNTCKSSNLEAEEGDLSLLSKISLYFHNNINVEAKYCSEDGAEVTLSTKNKEQYND